MVSNLHLVMHGVAIKKHCTAADISVLIGLPTDLVESELVSANTGGRVVLADGKYMLSPAGQMILLGEYSRFYADLRADSRFADAYDRFENNQHGPQAINHGMANSRNRREACSQ